MTFLQFAKGFVEGGEYDVDGGQDIQVDSRTSLHLAVIKNDIVMINNLLQDQANPNKLDHHYLSPLGLAIKEDRIDIANLILKYASRINFRTAENSRMLLLSIDKLNIELTEDLLRHGCDPNVARDHKTGENCIHLIIQKMSSSIDRNSKHLDINELFKKLKDQDSS